MLFWLIVIFATALGVLVALKGWAWVKNRANTLGDRIEKRGGLLWETAESEIDDFVAEASKYRPYLEKMLLFYVGLFLTALMIAFDIKFGFSRGGFTFSGLVLALLFVAADLALPVVTLRSDKGTAKFWKLAASDRDPISWSLIVMCTLLSVFVVIGSTSEVANTTGAKTKISQLTYQQKIENIGRWKAEIARLPEDRGYTALKALADSTAEAAERESKRKYCGSKCERLKKEAAQYEARAADAKRKEELAQRIAAAELYLKNMGDARTDSDPFANTVSTFSNGAVSKDAASKYSTTLFGLIAVFICTLVWLRVADQANAQMRQEYLRRGAIGDAKRRELNLPAKFLTEEGAGAASTEAPPALPGDTIVVNMAAEDMRRRYKNDPHLLAVDTLFGTVLVEDEDGATPTTDLYKQYREIQIKAGELQFMTPPVMAQKLSIIAKERDDVALTADGRILGWSLKSQTDEAQHE